MDPKSEKGAIKLCCSRGCPTVEFLGPDNIIIKDDFGGKVQLNDENLTMLTEAYQKSKEERDDG